MADDAAPRPTLRVEGLDHVVLVVADVERSAAWYGGRLGLVVEGLDAWRAGTLPFPSVRVDEGTILDLLEGEPTGRNVDHLCLVVAPTDLAAAAAGLEVLEGPVRRSGARGTGTSIYVRDPDGHTVELRHYG